MKNILFYLMGRGLYTFTGFALYGIMLSDLGTDNIGISIVFTFSIVALLMIGEYFNTLYEKSMVI